MQTFNTKKLLTEEPTLLSKQILQLKDPTNFETLIDEKCKAANTHQAL